MLVPLLPLDFELAAQPLRPIPVPSRFRRARVLVRWQGTPLGVVELSVRSGHVDPADVVSALQRRHAHALPREAVRRALLGPGVAGRLGPDLTRLAPPPAPPAATHVSVIVCTRDRPADLARCLASLAVLSPPPGEILVIDNAPATDATARLVRDSYPKIRYVREPQAGLDRARNRGLQEAAGAIFAFTDDDVVADPGWVGAVAAAFADPAVGLVTGLVEPVELETRAQVLFERYGGFGRGCRRHHLQAPRHAALPWTLAGAGQLGAGANMALRRELVQQIGGFDPALDVGTPTLGGGDHDLFFRALRAGALCVYDPAAIVRHRHRRTVAELRKLLFSYGHGTQCWIERAEAEFPETRPALRQLRRWWWRHWARGRLWRAATRPGWFPPELVREEIRGFRRGRGVYAVARRRLVPDETLRPDAAQPPPPFAPDFRPGAIGIASVDVSAPLAPLAEGARFDALQVVVHWRGRPVGTVRIATHGCPLSAERLADRISDECWFQLLDPAAADPSVVLLDLYDRLKTRAAAAAIVPREAATATIVLTTCNRPAELRRCLQSLVALQTPRAVQIVVVDNRPETQVAAPVVREFPGVELIAETRRGSSYARNAGVTAARGEFVAMIDDDMRVAPDWLERLLAPFARADVMAVTGNTLAARLETAAERTLEAYGGFCRGFEPKDYDAGWFQRWRLRAVPTWRIGGSGNLAFRREIFSWRSIGRFDEALGAGVPTGVGEDTKLFYDILAADYTIVYEPAAVAWHYHRTDMAGLRRQLYAYSKGHVAYHLTTWLEHRDVRALVRILGELPLAFFQRSLDRLRSSRSAAHGVRYPFRLILLELLGTLAGPWSLWQARRLARQIARQQSPGRRPAGVPLLVRKETAFGVSP